MASDPGQDVTILDSGDAHFAQGETFILLRRWQEAIEAYEAAIAVRPGYPEAWNRRGVALHELGEDEDALDSFAEALSVRPGFAEAHSNRGVSLRMLNRCEEALAAADAALAADPTYWAAFTTRGNALRSLGRIDEALRNYDLALERFPGNAAAHFNRAICRLLAGDFAGGWAEYEWRWKMAAHQERARVFERPLWLGDRDIAGQTIMLHPEQGLGDTIQFCRYAPLAAAQGATVLLGAAPALHGVLSTLAGVSLIVSRTEAMPRFDLQCPLMSLPLAFRTTLETVPAAVPYLAAPEAHQRKWRDRLGARLGPRIGLVWSGNPSYGNDRNRSLSLDMIAEALPPGVAVHCLQREIRPGDIPALAMRPNVVFHGGNLSDFSDTAAIAAEMDLVISVDTAVLHLAGAMGLPVWGLLPFASDWRWLLDRDDTPWYPSMRLFRQKSPGDWEPVIEDVRRELGRFRETWSV